MPVRKADQRCGQPRSVSVPTVTPAGWRQSTESIQVRWGGREASDEGTALRAAVLPQHRLSHTEQLIRNSLIYFYREICTGKGRSFASPCSPWSRLAAHERVVGPEGDSHSLHSPW